MLVKACLNGGRTRAEHPAVPRSPAELAADALAVVRAGVRALHLHPRDESAAESLAAADVLTAVAAVRAAVPGIPVGVTTGLWAAGGDPELRLELVSGWTGPDAPDFASVNVSEPGCPELAGLLSGLGIGVEAGVWSVADADALAAARDGYGQLVRILVEAQVPAAEAAVELAAQIDAALDRHGFTEPRLHHGEGAGTWQVLRAAIRTGRDIRIGLEDTLELPDGSTTTGNSQLVAEACAMVRATSSGPDSSVPGDSGVTAGG
jgi:uncharacterized protein (DUF849 family)